MKRILPLILSLMLSLASLTSCNEPQSELTASPDGTVQNGILNLILTQTAWDELFPSIPTDRFILDFSSKNATMFSIRLTADVIAFLGTETLADVEIRTDFTVLTFRHEDICTYKGDLTAWLEWMGDFEDPFHQPWILVQAEAGNKQIADIRLKSPKGPFPEGIMMEISTFDPNNLSADLFANVKKDFLHIINVLDIKVIGFDSMVEVQKAQWQEAKRAMEEAKARADGVAPTDPNFKTVQGEFLFYQNEYQQATQILSDSYPILIQSARIPSKAFGTTRTFGGIHDLADEKGFREHATTNLFITDTLTATYRPAEYSPFVLYCIELDQ